MTSDHITVVEEKETNKFRDSTCSAYSVASQEFLGRSMKNMFDTALADYDRLLEKLIPDTTPKIATVTVPANIRVYCDRKEAFVKGSWSFTWGCAECKVKLDNSTVTCNYPFEDEPIFKIACPECSYSHNAPVTCSHCNETTHKRFQDPFPSLNKLMKENQGTSPNTAVLGASRLFLAAFVDSVRSLWTGKWLDPYKQKMIIHHFPEDYRAIVEKILCVRQGIRELNCGSLLWMPEHTTSPSAHPWIKDGLPKESVITIPALKLIDGSVVKGRSCVVLDPKVPTLTTGTDEKDKLWNDFLDLLK